jgi:hypothetical protein
MNEAKLELPERIPGGWRILCRDIDVAGIHFHLDEAIAFATVRDHALGFEPDPTNAHDPNAIKVIGFGTSNGKAVRLFLGFVPRGIAAQLVGNCVPQLREIWAGGTHQLVMKIRFDILVEESSLASQPATIAPSELDFAPAIVNRTLRFLPPIPDGWRILIEDLEITPTQARMADVLAFASGEMQELRFERGIQTGAVKPSIRLYGTSTLNGSRTEVLLGYAPDDTDVDAPEECLARLRSIWLGGQVRQTARIRCDVLCRKPTESEIEKFKAQTLRSEAARKQRIREGVQRPTSLPAIRLRDWAAGETGPIYCSKCRKVWHDIECPQCGRDLFQDDMSDCAYCGTEYEDSLQKCPICTIATLLEEAEDCAYEGDLSQAIAKWIRAHNDAQAENRFFTCDDVFPYAGYLAEAGFHTDAIAVYAALERHCSEKPNQMETRATAASIQESKMRGLALDPNVASDPAIKTEILLAGVRWQIFEVKRQQGNNGGQRENGVAVSEDAIYRGLRKALKLAGLSKRGREKDLWSLAASHLSGPEDLLEQPLRSALKELVVTWSGSTSAKG